MPRWRPPGDVLNPDGSLTPGPHHQVPPCRHFPVCGGCQLQHLDDAAYAAFVTDRIAGALAAHDLATDIRAPILSPPRTRRRATLHAEPTGGRMRIGFRRDGEPCAGRYPGNATSSRRNCSRWWRRCASCSRRLDGKRRTDVQMTLCDQGVEPARRCARGRAGGGRGDQRLLPGQSCRALCDRRRAGPGDALGARSGDGDARRGCRCRSRTAPSSRRPPTARRR